MRNILTMFTVLSLTTAVCLLPVSPSGAAENDVTSALDALGGADATGASADVDKDAAEEEKPKGSGIIDLEPADISLDEYPAESEVGMGKHDIPHGWTAHTIGADMIPIPDEAPFKWQFRFYFKEPRSIMVKTPGAEKPRLFWYIKFTIINRTGNSRPFDPEFQLYTETGQLLSAGEGFNSTAVFEKIKNVMNNPLLVDLNTATGKILQGEDNAVESVAIFRDFDPEAGRFDVFIGGLSGETAKIKLPNPIKIRKEKPFNPEKKTDASEVVETQEIILSKTLKLTYKIGSQAKDRQGAPLRFLGKEWVMR